MMSLFNPTPDKPVSFGFKTSWFALNASDAVSVVDALGLGEATPANWTSGLAASYSTGALQSDDGRLFVSPPVNGWVLAICSWLPYPTEEAHHDIGRKFDTVFSRLMKRFNDVQFFGSHRVSGFVTWAWATDGNPRRIFAYADGQVLANFGEQTSEEKKLGLVNLTGLSPPDAAEEIFRVAELNNAERDALIASGLFRREAVRRVRQSGRDFPNETDVVELAALWSIDPTRLSEQDHPAGLGLAAHLPQNLSQ